MRRAALAVVFTLVLVAPQTLARVPEKIASYRIEVTLDPEARRLEGNETISWRNSSNDTVRELQFHLYLNAFRNDQTTFMRESNDSVRGGDGSEDENPWGWIDIRSMKDAAGRRLHPRVIRPDSPDPEDWTVVSVPLIEPVPPGGSTTIDLKFLARMPHTFARTGVVDDFFLAGQWFPKLGVYEGAGVRGRAAGGWNCHQLHSDSEFYADFGSYDVTIDLPSRFIVGATGVLADKSVRGRNTRWHFRQDNVPDFAWTADPDFVRKEYVFDPMRDVPEAWRREAIRLHGPGAAVLRPVRITVLMQPQQVDQAGRYAEAAKKGLAWFGLFYAPYPWSTLTIVDPADGAAGAAGMEYPTFFTAETTPALARWPLSKVRVQETVVVHELGHQWFQSMIHSNEFEESWMDEGMATYAEQQVLDTAWDWGAIEAPTGHKLSTLAMARGGYLADDGVDPIMAYSWKYASSGSWGTNSYRKPLLMLHQLRARLGDDRFARAFRAYVEEWSFRHPTTGDFVRSMERSSGADLKAFSHGVLEGRQRFDIKVRSARSVRESPPRGIFTRNGKLELRDGDEDAADGGKDGYMTTVVVARLGELAEGAEVLFRFRDGHEERLPFKAESRWTRYRLLRSSKLVAVTVDPQLKNAWDTDLLNNSFKLEDDPVISSRFGGMVQSLSARILQLLWVLS